MTPLERAAKYERLAFMFCKMGTTGLIVWLLTPPVFVLIVAIIATALYAYAFSLGLLRSRCFLRKPLLIMATWVAIGALDVAWLIAR
jgi:hypothetical protein